MTQTNLFSLDALKARSDLDRLKLVIDHLPDERLVQDPGLALQGFQADRNTLKYR